MTLIQQLNTLEFSGLIRLINAQPNVEYIFRHALIQEAAYRSLIKNTRKQLHQIIGDVLEQAYAPQIDQYASLLAAHFLEADNTAKAVTYFRRAGEWAFAIGAPLEALQSFKQALALIPAADSAAHGHVCWNIGLVYQRQSEYPAAIEWYQRALTLAEASADHHLAAQVLSEMSAIAFYQGDYVRARTSAKAALNLSRAQGDQAGMALALRWLSVVSGAQDDYAAAIAFCTESLALYTQLNDRRGMGICANSLGIFAFDQGHIDEARTHIEQAVALSREIGDRYALGNRLMNLGTITATAGNTSQAKEYYAESLSISHGAGAKEDAATAICNLGDIALKEDNNALALTYYCNALTQAMIIGAQPLMLFTLAGLAEIEQRQGRPQRAAEWLGLIQNHPARDAQLTKQLQPTLTTLRGQLSVQEVESALQRGAQLDLEQVAREILAEYSSQP